MIEEGEKAICIWQFSERQEDWSIWADKVMAKANMRGCDEILPGASLAIGDGDQE